MFRLHEVTTVLHAVADDSGTVVHAFLQLAVAHLLPLEPKEEPGFGYTGDDSWRKMEPVRGMRELIIRLAGDATPKARTAKKSMYEVVLYCRKC
jgi:hypothetical protein